MHTREDYSIAYLSVIPDFEEYWNLTIDLGMNLLRTAIEDISLYYMYFFFYTSGLLLR